MGDTVAVHPTDQVLQSYGLGKLDDVSSASVSKHVEGCDSCQRRVAELSSDEFLGRLRNAQVKPDKSATSWSPSAASSTEGSPSPVDPPRPADTLPPELVDHPDYEIIRELGRGGMGVVYLAENKLMGRPEVLKVVGRQLVERPGVGDRFLREIRSAAKLHHPNIVTAHSAIRLGDSLVLAMEYVDGLDLAKMVKTKGPLPIAHACYFIHQAALGLQHAHERGMVHRDIKPANLMLAREGKKPIVKVLDFGLAKVTSEGQTDSGLTREGQMLGTPDYIAPEQIRNAQSADIRADIYSLGCTFYYLLTGGPPFRGDHLWDVYQAHFSMEAGPLNLVRPEVPVELAAVVAKMMAKEPSRRFQTPAEVARALTSFFKQAATQPVVGNTEVSQLAPPIASTQTPGANLSSTEPATGSLPSFIPPRREPSNAASLADRKRSTLPEPETRWESLIEFKDTEPLDDPAPAVIKTVPQKPKWLWPATAVGVVLMGLFVYFKLTARLEPPTIDRLEKIELHSITPSGGRIEPKVSEQPERNESPATTKSADVVHPRAIDHASFTELSGQWRVEGDELVQTDATRPYSELLFGDNQWTDYDFTVDAMRGGGGNSFALFFRSTDWNNEYTYVVSGDDSKPCAAEVREEGKSELLRYGFSIEDHRWYTARVHVLGNHFVCSLHDQATGTDMTLFDFHDERHLKGRVGLQTFGSSFRFKNIKVMHPDGTVLWDGPPAVGQTRQTALADPSIAEQESSVPASANPGRKKRLLAITESAAFVHKVAPTQVGQVLYELGDSGGFEVIFSQDSGWWIKPEHLKDFDAVFFYTSGELSITPEGKTALLEFVRSGKGFAGSHCAADTFYKWPEYGELIGAYFNKHLGLRDVAIRVDDPTHASTRHLDRTFRMKDEIYQFKAPFSRDKLHILMHFDYPGVTNGGVMAWTKDYGKGRVFYTALGHDEAVWNDERFRKHLLGGLRYVLNQETLAPESRSRGWVSLFNGKDLTGWVVDSGSKNAWRIEHGDLVVTGPGDYRKLGFLLTDRDYSDFHLKFDFQAAPGSNSGVAFWARPGELFGGIPHHPQIELLDADKREIKNGSFIWSRSIRVPEILPPYRPVDLKPGSLWHTMEVDVRAGLLRLEINSREVFRSDLTKLVEQPGAHPGLSRRSGRIGLQSHTGQVRFRNIEIKE